MSIVATEPIPTKWRICRNGKLVEQPQVCSFCQRPAVMQGEARRLNRTCTYRLCELHMKAFRTESNP